MNSVLEAPTAPQAETSAGETTKVKKKAKTAAPSPEMKQVLKRLEEQHKLGELIKRKEAQRAKQETAVAEAKAKRDAESETLHEYERELEELKDDLTNLAVGGFVDRLPFKDPKDATTAAPSNGQAAAPASPDAWKSVPLADVWREAGANVALLALLMDGKVKAGPQKNQVANLRTLGDLAAFTSREHAKLTDISGIGPEKAGAIETAVDTYWGKHPQELTTAPAHVRECCTAAAAASGLDWKPMSEAQHFAETRSGIKLTEGKSTPQFVVMKSEGRWEIGQSNSCLLPTDDPGSFDTIEGAKDWCSKREAELCAKAEYVPLAWESEEDSVWFAPNTAGIETEADLLAEFDVRQQTAVMFTIDGSEDTLLPINFPESFLDLASAQAYCEARNRELCLKAREQMPELYEHNELPELTDKPAKKPKAKKTPNRKTVVKK